MAERDEKNSQMDPTSTSSSVDPRQPLLEVNEINASETAASPPLTPCNANVVDDAVIDVDDEQVNRHIDGPLTPLTVAPLLSLAESDLLQSSDCESDGNLNGSELNAATTTEDEDVRHHPTEVIKLRVLSRRDDDGIPPTESQHHPPHQSPQDDSSNVQNSTVVSFESEIDNDGEQASRQHSSDQISEQSSSRMIRMSDMLLRYQTGTTALETTADTEDDHGAATNRRPVKIKKKKLRRSSTSETDTAIDSRSSMVDAGAAHRPHHHHHHHHHHHARRIRHARRADDPTGTTEARIIFAPFPLAIISNTGLDRDNDAARRARALGSSRMPGIDDDDDVDEGDVDDDHGNEKEDDDDVGIDDMSVPSTCTSMPVTRQTSLNINDIVQSPSLLSPCHSSSSSTSSSSVPTCRICFQPEEPGPAVMNHLVSPCLCEGSVKYMHQVCVNRWIAESGTSSCELCGYRFHMRTLTMRNILRWRTFELSPWDRIHLSLAFFSLLFVVVSLTYMLWVSISSDPSAVYTRQSLASEILFPIYACLDALTLCVCSYEVSRTVKRLWRRLRAVNSCLFVMDRPRAKRRQDSARMGSARNAEDSNSERASPGIGDVDVTVSVGGVAISGTNITATDTVALIPLATSRDDGDISSGGRREPICVNGTCPLAEEQPMSIADSDPLMSRSASVNIPMTSDDGLCDYKVDVNNPSMESAV